MRNMIRTLSCLLILPLLIPVAAAAGNDVGASGRCFDSDGSGGEDALVVRSDGQHTLLTGTGAAFAVLALTNDPVGASQGNGCTGADSGEDTDHVEAHARVNDVGAEVCYDGGVRTDGGCYLAYH